MKLAAGGGRIGGVLLLCALLGHGSITEGVTPADRERALRAFLQNWTDRKLDAGGRASTRYVRAWVNLRENGEEQVIVYIEGSDWCGSGGCIMLVLQPANATFQIIGKTTITRPPIRVLAHFTNGWRDICVRVGGGRILPYYDAGLPFDGRGYPGNPTVPPARRLSGEQVGTTVITGNEHGEPLYPR